MFLKDFKYCPLLGTSNSFCIDFVSSSLDLSENLCKSLDSYKKSFCIIDLAISKKNPGICSSFGDEPFNCYYQLSFYLDKLNINEDFCNKINEESLKFTCLAKLKNDKNVCENITQEPFEKIDCVALVSKNESYCSNDSTNYDYCLMLVALEKKDSKLCDQIKTEPPKIECLLRIKGNIDSCNTFEGSWKDYCTLDFFKLRNLKII